VHGCMGSLDADVAVCVPWCRGAAWVGTAPPKQYESVAVTTAKREPLEFQSIKDIATGALVLRLVPLP
jgi:hypothetical protein